MEREYSFKACGCQLQKGVNVQQVAINKTLGHKKWGRRKNVHLRQKGQRAAVTKYAYYYIQAKKL